MCIFDLVYTVSKFIQAILNIDKLYFFFYIFLIYTLIIYYKQKLIKKRD